MMSEVQADIDALLAQATALAEDTVPAMAAVATAPPPPPAPAMSSAAASFYHPLSPHDAEDPARILRLQVPVIVRLAERTMPLSEIINLSTGAIIEFDKPLDAELDLMINNKRIGRGQAVKVGENFGLRLTSVGSVRDRIEAMGPGHSGNHKS
jgi:flagellar motor switch protein FliN/FliY